MFFDNYPRFFETSKVHSGADRLNLRYEAMFAEHRDRFQGARVLDISSHDGRWTLAALRTGAAHVTGIEARPDAVERARENLSHYGVEESSYRFVTGDVFDILARETFDVDLVMCLGFFYHTYRHTELLHGIRRIDPQWLLMDTSVVRGEARAMVRVRTDSPDNPAQAVLDPYGHGDRTLVGRPSVPAVFRMLQAYDFGVQQQCDWPALIDRHPGVTDVDDYRTGARVTVWGRSGADTSVKPDLLTTPKAAKPKKSTRPSAGEPPAPPAPEPSQTTSDTAARTPLPTRLNRALAALTGYEFRRAE